MELPALVTLVALRYLFNSSITGANELVTILFVYTTAIGAAVAVGKGEHIAISLAVEKLSRRGRRIAEIIQLLLVAGLNAVMIFYSIAWIRITGEFLMPSTGLPRAAVQMSVPIGCGLAIVYCVLRLISPLPDSTGIERDDHLRNARSLGNPIPGLSAWLASPGTRS